MLSGLGSNTTDFDFFDERGQAPPRRWPSEEGREPPGREKEWQTFFQQSQRILGLFLMFTFLTAGLVLAVLSWQKKTSFDLEKTDVLGREKSASPEAAPAPPPLLIVDLGGAVSKTGVFRLPEGSRLEDLLNLAGGLSAAADPGWVEKNLNLAARLFDGEKIYIPSRGEVAPPSGDQGASGVAILGGKAAAKVNINTAAVAQLEALPGLGPTDAQGIVEYRQKNGPFQSIEEIQRVSGIKAGKFAKIKDLITVN